MKIILITLSLILNLNSYAKECYQTAAKNFKVEWTAFKTPLKAGVKGSFRDLGLKKETYQGKNLKNFLEGIEFSIDTASTTTKNTARDATIVKHFFQKMNGGLNINGKIESYNKKVVTVKLTFNEVTQSIPLKVSTKKNSIIARGTIDLLDFSLNKALASINKACYELHEGKTWNDIDLKLKIKLDKKC
ncbi:MAG: YceI family protein [Bacteriovoracaceae bacterium]|jgi:polyisoprenoid-binding protein YceI|nr:hypothetical protein [Halobacteriovoraceae bacterium]MDP7320345.1 YceI family protein [Bacteriovoracaceae bacterium]|tara:strand:+ start:53 stop:619 length:567 start_codon:yes stop_codon:yes gene_type:complete